jgi:pyruvate dehydrogenase E2 component (dihydrolipoamide acetyltransferase)
MPKNSSLKEIVVPDIGDFDSVEVIEILVSEGDAVAVEDSLISVESDKATMEIPAPEAGVITEIKIALGDKVSMGSLILMLEPSGEPAPAKATAEPAQQSALVAAAPVPVAAKHTSAPAHRPSPTAQIDEVSFSKAYASPSVRKFARELGVDLGRVGGSGRKGRVIKDDVKSYVKQALTQGGGGGMAVAPMPEIDFSQWGEVETKPLSKINKLTGKFLHRNWVTVPHVTQFDEADITDLEVRRKSMAAEYKDKGIKITPLVFMMKAVVAAMKELPKFNSSA